jgi:hypothetical protein
MKDGKGLVRSGGPERQRSPEQPDPDKGGDMPKNQHFFPENCGCAPFRFNQVYLKMLISTRSMSA